MWGEPMDARRMEYLKCIFDARRDTAKFRGLIFIMIFVKVPAPSSPPNTASTRAPSLVSNWKVYTRDLDWPRLRTCS